MLPMSPFSLSEPSNLSELATELSRAHQKTKILAGGTDLLPNLKHGLYDVSHLISLRRINELKCIETNDKSLTLGALIKLNEVANNPLVQRHAKSLATSSAHIASPQIRNMGTVGGNICLDTRCLYFNQTEFWRSSLGFCLKKDGCACHVVKTGKRCVAAASNDLATALLAYKGRVNIFSCEGNYSMELDDFYTANGEKNNVLPLGQVVTNVTVDLVANAHAGFYKVRMRESIDFPLLSIANHFVVEGGKFISGRLVINALVAKPKVLDLADFANSNYNRELIHAIADFARLKCHPQTNLAGDLGFRKHMVLVGTKRAFQNALATG